ncbi:MAG: hypothetical protein IPL12_16140 [Bacteroidetes bacterium]|nr:hypothetical protein [Bacteroidota bacterium]
MNNRFANTKQLKKYLQNSIWLMVTSLQQHFNFGHRGTMGNLFLGKSNLDPKRCNGHTYRYSTDGWGLIQLYFGGIRNGELHQSHIGHFNEKGALKWEGTNKTNGLVNLWDWTEIQVTSRKLKYYIHNKLAARKIDSIGVLP